MGAREPRAKGYGTGIHQRQPFFVLFQQIFPILCHHCAKLQWILGLKQHERAVVGQRFHYPLITISGPEDSVAPPLMSSFVGDYLFAQGFADWAHVLLRFLGWSKKGVT